MLRLAYTLVLLLAASVAGFAQRSKIEQNGGALGVNAQGAVIIKPRSGKDVTVDGPAVMRGHVAIGQDATVDQDYLGLRNKAVVNVRETFTDLTTPKNYGSNVVITAAPTADQPANAEMIAEQGEILVAQSNTRNFYHLMGGAHVVENFGRGRSYAMTGEYGLADHYSTGTVTIARGGLFIARNASTTATTANLIGVHAQAVNKLSGTVTNMRGFQTNVANHSTGMVEEVNGLRVAILNSGTIGTSYGAMILTPTKTNPGSYTNVYGLYIQNHDAIGSAKNFNFYSAGSAAKNHVEGTMTAAAGLGPAQGVLWTTGTRAPSGPCSSGSLYTNQTGDVNTTLWVCVSGSWVAK